MRSLIFAAALALAACTPVSAGIDGSGGAPPPATEPARPAPPATAAVLRALEQAERRFTQAVLTYGQAVDIARPLVRASVIRGANLNRLQTANRAAMAAIRRGNAAAERADKIIEADTLNTAEAVIRSLIPGRSN